MTNRDLFYRYLGLPGATPLGLEVVKAEGIRLYDSEGKDYIDLVSGITVSNTGHRHPKVMQAIREQMEKYLYLNVYGEMIQAPQVEFARALASLLPEPLRSVYFVNSGSEAVEGAMKLAKRYTGRTEVIAFNKAYHGSTQGALSILGHESLKQAFRPLIPDIRFIEFNNADDLLKITNRTACVVAETIQAEAGIILPEEGYLQKLRKRCTETGTLLVIDDVQMGLGRTGMMFSFEHYGFVPDILVLAKALGGGLPLGAFISSREVMSSLSHDPELGHITTFGGHPLSCAAGLAALNIVMDENLAEQAEMKGSIFEKSLQQYSCIKEIRRKGLVLGVELNKAVPPATFLQRCLDHGLVTDWFLFSTATFRIAPPLTITGHEIEQSIERLEKCLSTN
jgi:acetylornithine/N-succinyldiaminopimelate aminotransferase